MSEHFQKLHSLECTEKKITYTKIDGRLVRIYRFTGLTIYMPMNSVDEEVKEDEERRAKYGGREIPFPSMVEATPDPNDLRDLELSYQNSGIKEVI